VLALAVGLAVLVGVALGLLGGGGSILTVPLLVYVAGMDAKEAIAASLFVVGFTALAGLVSHARAGNVRWRTGLLFGAAGMAGAFVGGLIGGHLPSRLLLAAFAVVMLATAVAMLRGRRIDPAKAHRELPVARVLLDGAVVGLVTGLVGAGGGFLVVPALALLGGLPIPVAVGTSLVVIAMKSFAGFAGYLSTVSVSWLPVLAISAAAIVGGLAGGWLAERIPQDLLRTAFGWFVLVMGMFMLVQQLEGDLRWVALGVMAALVLVGVACVTIWTRCPVRSFLRGNQLTAAGV
jgi:uncharacterized membrane protein YfcA